MISTRSGTAVDALDNKVPAAVQHEMLLAAGRLVERATAWFLRSPKLDIAAETAAPSAPASPRSPRRSTTIMPRLAPRRARRARAALEEHGVPAALARSAARLDFLVSAVDIVRLAVATGQNVVELGRRFFAIGARFRLDALRVAARKLDADTAWQKRAVAAVIEDLYAQQAELTAQGGGREPRFRGLDRAPRPRPRAARGARARDRGGARARPRHAHRRDPRAAGRAGELSAGGRDRGEPPLTPGSSGCRPDRSTTAGIGQRRGVAELRRARWRRSCAGCGA